MNLQQRTNRLRAAHRLVRKVKDSLNHDTHTCGSCGVEVAENRNQQQVREMLNGVLSRLEKSIDRMGNQAEFFKD